MSSLEEISRDNGAFTTIKIQAHLRLLRIYCAVEEGMRFINHPHQINGRAHLTDEMKDQYLHHYLLVAHWRYRYYLDILVKLHEKGTPKENWPLPPWDVALMMQTHMLHPVAFQKDLVASVRYNTLAGLLDFPLMKLDYKSGYMNVPGMRADSDAVIWAETYPMKPYRMMDFVERIEGSSRFPYKMTIAFHWLPTSFKMAARPPPFSFDLREAAKRQLLFARKITAVYPYDPVPDNLLLDCQQRYAKFMNLIRMNQNPAIVPAVDIDLVWHTHQLSPTTYMPWCTRHVGIPINHDDTVAEGELTTGLDDTVAAWEAAYSEDYLNPSPGPVVENFPAAPAPAPLREPTIRDKTPPPGLTQAQLNLWHFDVTHQGMHERLDFTIRQRRTELKFQNTKVQEIASASAASSAKAKANGGGFMKRLINKAASEFGGERSSAVAQQQNYAYLIRDLLKTHEEEKQAWGRARWPYLVAARGWGDPRVTEGKWVRPPQGTASLDFPIYAATWYDNKELGYYNYVSGGKDGNGAVEGGGVRVGGAMCAGRFDGGNCIAAPIIVPTGGGEGGGGT